MIVSSEALPTREIKLNDHCAVITNTKVRNLGLIFDQTFSMANQVQTLFKSLNFQLKKIGHIRNYIVAIKLVTSHFIQIRQSQLPVGQQLQGTHLPYAEVPKQCCTFDFTRQQT